MGKLHKPIRRPTEERALARVSREEAKKSDRELFEEAQRLFKLREARNANRHH